MNNSVTATMLHNAGISKWQEEICLPQYVRIVQGRFHIFYDYSHLNLQASSYLVKIQRDLSLKFYIYLGAIAIWLLVSSTESSRSGITGISTNRGEKLVYNIPRRYIIADMLLYAFVVLMNGHKYVLSPLVVLYLQPLYMTSAELQFAIELMILQKYTMMPW